MLGKPLTALRRRQKLPNQNRRTSYRPRIKSADAHGGREHDACFSSMLGSRPSAPGKLAARINSRSHDGQNSLVAGKNAGNFVESAFFAKIHLENIREFSGLRMNSLHRQSREFFCQGRELIREQGIRRKTGPRPPTHLMAYKYFNVMDKKIVPGCGCGRTRLASLDRPRRGYACRAPDQIRRRA